MPQLEAAKRRQRNPQWGLQRVRRMDKSGEHLIVIVRKEDSARAVCKLVCAVSNRGQWHKIGALCSACTDGWGYGPIKRMLTQRLLMQCCSEPEPIARIFKENDNVAPWRWVENKENLSRLWSSLPCGCRFCEQFGKTRQTDTDKKCKCFVCRYQGESIVHKRGGGGRN